ncbi:hypothetical protein QQ045_007614 [Rhodiola kirilowii]
MNISVKEVKHSKKRPYVVNTLAILSNIILVLIFEIMWLGDKVFHKGHGKIKIAACFYQTLIL